MHPFKESTNTTCLSSVFASLCRSHANSQFFSQGQINWRKHTFSHSLTLLEWENYCIRRFVDKNWRLKVSKFSATITWLCLPYCSVHHLSFSYIFFRSKMGVNYYYSLVLNSYKQKLTNENIAEEPGLLRGLFQTTKTSQPPGMIRRKTKIFKVC